MSITLKSGIIGAILWIVIRLSAFYLGIFQNEVEPFVFLNMLGVTLAITFGLYYQKKKDGSETNTMLDIKNGMKAGVVYAFLVSIFIYFYYQSINPGYIKTKLAEIELKIDEALADPAEVAKIRKSNEGYEVLSLAQMKNQMMSGPKSFFAPGSTMTISMLALLLWSTLNAILITIVFRRMIFRQ